jgi:hypothetical protein
MPAIASLSRTHRQNLLLLVLAFLLSRGLAFWAGMHYLGNEDAWLIQLLDLDILHRHLLRGLFHLHAQPPLFNLLLGISLKLAGPHYDWLMLGLQMLLDLASGIAVYLTLVTLEVYPTFSLIVSLVLLLNPAAILYDFDALYTTIVYSMHCFIALAAARYAATRSSRALGWLTALCVALTLLRSTYHWIWLICLFAILWWRVVPNRRQILKAATIGLLLALVWPAKNYVLFRHFSSTTWAPYNLSRMWGGTPLVKARSPLLPTLAPVDLSQEHAWLSQHWAVPAVGYPELDDIARADGATNWNSLTMLHLHDAQVRDDLYLFRHDPRDYVHHVFLASLLYFAPADKYLVASGLEFWQPSIQLYGTIEPINRPLSRICCYPLGYRSATDSIRTSGGSMWIHLREVCLGAIFAFALMVTCLLSFRFWPALWAPSPRASDSNPARKTVVLLAGFTILYAFALSSLLEIGENMRFRYETHALVLIAGAIFLQQIWTHRRMRPKPPPADMVSA